MRVVSGPAAVQAVTAAPQAAQTVATAAAPKPRTPAPARPAGGAPAPARKEAPVAPTGQVGKANEDLLAQVRGEQDVARQARYGGLVEKEIPNAKGTPVKQLRFAENEDPTAFYARKLEDVMRLRATRQLGPGGSVRGMQLPEKDLVQDGMANVDFVRGVKPFQTDPKSLGEPREMLPQAQPGMRENYVEVPTGGPGGALDSVAAFRQRAEQLGLRYREAKRALAQADEETAQAKLNPLTRVSTDLPKLAAAQRARAQEFVNAREALRQMGFVGNEAAGVTAEQEMNKYFGS